MDTNFFIFVFAFVFSLTGSVAGWASILCGFKSTKAFVVNLIVIFGNMVLLNLFAWFYCR